MEWRFKGGVFALRVWWGLYLEGLIHGGAYFRNFTVPFFEIKTPFLSSLSISDKLNISNCCLPSHAGFKGWRIPLSKELQWRIQGRGSGSPTIFRPNCGPRCRKNLFLEPHPPPPLSKGLYDRVTPLSQGLDPALEYTEFKTENGNKIL